MSEHRARCFVLGRSPARESDLRVSLLTEHGARLVLHAHGAQRSSRRFPTGLMPLTLYEAAWTEGRQGLRLDEAPVLRAWPALLDDLRRNTAAVIGTCFAAEMSEAEPGDSSGFLLLGELYDALSLEAPDRAAARLARFALESLTHAGMGIALDRCVRCDTPAPEGALVTVDPSEGGIVCRGCGGGPYRLSADDRRALRAREVAAASPGDEGLLSVCAALVRGATARGAEHLERASTIFSSRKSSNESRAKMVRDGEG